MENKLESYSEVIDEEDEITRKVINNLNNLFGKDLKKLATAKERVEILKSTQKELEKKLLFATSEAPDRITKAINTAEKVLNQVDETESRVVKLNKQISEVREREDVVSLLEEITPHLKVIEDAKKIKAYKSWISSIQELSQQIESCLKLGHEDQAFMHYDKLKESAEAILNSQCLNLKEYTLQIVLHWHHILLSRLESEFQSVLKLFNWPFVESSASQKAPPPSSESKRRLEVVISHLLRLEVPSDIRNGVRNAVGVESHEKNVEKASVPSFVSSFQVMSTPLQLLLKPFEVRFMYHFSGEKATNSRKNPEWYLTQVLKWITSHESFIDTYIQPILNKVCEVRISAKIEFTKGLLRLVVLKLSSDLPQIESDEDLFCLTIQETLNFEREIRLGFAYPTSQPTVLSVLTQASVFSGWIAIERKFALELMDEFVANVNAWQSDEEGGICQCGEQLILLLQGITDRYKPLSQPGHRLQFLDLQLELLDDFRVRLLQLTKGELSDPLQSNYIPILNTVHYLVTAISDWADLPFFIEMQYFKAKFRMVEERMNPSASQAPLLDSERDVPSTKLYSSKSVDITESVFSPVLDLYSRIESEMLSVVNQHVLTEVRARSQSYRKDKWFVSPSEGFRWGIDTSSLLPEVSPSLCPMLGALVKHLLLLRRNLAPELFSKQWKDMASALDKFIYEEVILQNTFSEYGAAQLKHDMTKALFPIFGEFTNKPDNYFPLVKECLVLLNLPRPTAFLLRDTLLSAENGRECFSQSLSPVKALEENGVFELSVREAKIILNIRTNMAM